MRAVSFLALQRTLLAFALLSLLILSSGFCETLITGFFPFLSWPLLRYEKEGLRLITCNSHFNGFCSPYLFPAIHKY